MEAGIKLPPPPPPPPTTPVHVPTKPTPFSRQSLRRRMQLTRTNTVQYICGSYNTISAQNMRAEMETELISLSGCGRRGKGHIYQTVVGTEA